MPGSIDSTLAAELNSLEITIPLSAHDPSSGRIWVIDRPWDKLCDKYFSDGNVLSVEFDLYAARRSASDPSWLNRLEGADMMVTGLMNSQMSSSDVDAVLANHKRIEETLRAIPADLRLADVDPASEPLCSTLITLIAAFRHPYVSVAKVMKTLCQKRPHFFPMLDSFVRRALYNDDPVASAHDPIQFGQGVVYEIELFRRVLLWKNDSSFENYPRLVQLADALTKRLSPVDEQLSDIVTPVRLLDDLIWFEWGGCHHFGWKANMETRRVEKMS